MLLHPVAGGGGRNRPVERSLAIPRRFGNVSSLRRALSALSDEVGDRAGGRRDRCDARRRRWQQQHLHLPFRWQQYTCQRRGQAQQQRQPQRGQLPDHGPPQWGPRRDSTKSALSVRFRSALCARAWDHSFACEVESCQLSSVEAERAHYLPRRAGHCCHHTSGHSGSHQLGKTSTPPHRLNGSPSLRSQGSLKQARHVPSEPTGGRPSLGSQRGLVVPMAA